MNWGTLVNSGPTLAKENPNLLEYQTDKISGNEEDATDE